MSVSTGTIGDQTNYFTTNDDQTSIHSQDDAVTAPPFSVCSLTESLEQSLFLTAQSDLGGDDLGAGYAVGAFYSDDGPVPDINQSHPFAGFRFVPHVTLNSTGENIFADVPQDVLNPDNLLMISASAAAEADASGHEAGDEAEAPEAHASSDDARIRSALERMETSVDAILSGMGSLRVANSTVSPQQLSAPYHRTVGPRRRPAKMASLARQVRDEIKRLLGAHFMDANQVVTPDVLKAFAGAWTAESDVNLQPICCDIEDFKIDLLGSPRSPWNQSAARVFSVYFVRAHSLDNGQYYHVTHIFYQRMKSLQAAYRKISVNLAAKRAAASAKRRQQRRQSIFNKRLDIALQHPLLQQHVPMLQKLGVSGMSSDESDCEDDLSGQTSRYLVHKPAWRADAVSEWLKVFDSIHVLSRRLSADGSRGSFPRLRVSSEIESQRGFVKGLSVSAYNPRWLKDHITASFNVAPTSECYSFSHDNRVFAFLRQRRM